MGGGARVLVVGLDGATWDLADRFVDEGQMPVLAGLLRQSLRAPLNSTTPPMTLPSWCSMLTGCNPGRHGIFDFVMKEEGGFGLELANATHRGVPTLHRVLSDRGARVASLAVPTTWPPDPVNGVVISGFDSPVSTGIDGSFVHPAGLHNSLQRRFGDLRFADFQESHIGPGWHDDALSALLREIPRKEDIARYLLGQERWDLFMVLFGESDTVSHHFWMFHDEHSPRHPKKVEPRLRNAIRSIYSRLDLALGRLIEAARPDLLLICSDHGFGGAGVHVLHLNRFLESAGLLRYQRQVRVEGLRAGSAWFDRAKAAAVAHVPAHLQGRLFRALPAGWLGRAEGESRYADLDKAATRAFSDEMNYAATIHLQGEPGARAALAAELEARLPTWEVDGQRVVTAVHRREALYEGPFVGRSPDLVLELALREGYSYTLLPSARAAAGQTFRVLDPQEHVGGKGLGMNGSHRQHGVMLLQGSGVPAGTCAAGMADLAPTILAWMGEDVPAHMDGRVLPALGLSVGRSRSEAATGPRHVASAAERGALQDRLERLGYL